MKHHSPEEWLLFMDGEASPEVARTLADHIASCPECAAELEGWRRSAEKLRRLPFPMQKPVRRRAFNPVKLGLAAVIVLFAGIAIGRFTRPNLDEMKRSVAAEVRQQLTMEMHQHLEHFRRGMEQQRTADAQHYNNLIANVRAQDVADCLALRQDLETAVSEADASLRLDRRAITELATTVSNNH